MVRAPPGFLDQRLEGVGLAHREIGEHLAVDLDARLVQAGDEPAIGQAEGAGRRIDPLDPQGAEIALALAAVAIGILAGLLDRLHGGAKHVLAPAIIALGLLDDLS